MQEYLAAIRQTGYDGVVSIELEYSPEPEKIVEWVEEAYRRDGPDHAKPGRAPLTP